MILILMIMTTSKTVSMFALLAIAVSMSMTPAFAASASNPWGSYYENPNSSSGDERADATANNSYVYARVPDSTQYTTNDAWVYQNLASNQTPGSTPSQFIGSGASSVKVNVEFAYDGNIKADAWAGTAELWKGAKLYRDGSYLTIFGNQISGAGDKTNTSDTENFSYSHSGEHTYKAAGYLQAIAGTGFFTGEQIVDFWVSPHYVLVKDIEITT